MYTFIVNPASRTGMGLSVWEKIRAELEQRKLPYEVHFTEYPLHTAVLTREICARIQEPFVLGVLGGDGTANEVLANIPQEALPRITFAYIPSGSSNDLARGLNISTNPTTIVDHLVSGGPIIDMDYGTVMSVADTTGEVKSIPYRFAVSSGIGFDAAVCEEVQRSKLKHFLNRLHLGKLCYLLIAVKNIFTCPTIDMTIQIDDAPPKLYRNVFFAAAMNQRIEGGGLAVAPNADPTDHHLSLCIIHNFPKIKVLILFPALLLGGKHVHFKGVDIVNCIRADIQAAVPMYVHTDGEDQGRQTHVVFTCPSDTIRMLV